MTCVLIVDDDPAQLLSLARVIGVRASDLSVLTAPSGAEAIEILRSRPVELVLTDIQMPGMNGFELLAWIATHQPDVLVFTMTAYPDHEAMERLRDLGNLECFTKPLDIAVVMGRLSSALSDSVRGHVRNISLAAFLQLIEMERKTCTLTVEAGGKSGQLFLRGGALVDARCGEHWGEPAAYEILAWPAPAILISGRCHSELHTVESPLGFVIMEAMRLQDEALRDTLTEDPLHSEVGLDDTFGEAPPPPPSLSEFPADEPKGADALAIIEIPSGRVRTSAGDFAELEAVAKVVARVYEAERAAVAHLGLEDDVEELVLTTPRFWALARPIGVEPGNLALLVFDPERANLALERFELGAFLRALNAWDGEPGGAGGGRNG
jgi:CheY-like chemotaxis protein